MICEKGVRLANYNKRDSGRDIEGKEDHIKLKPTEMKYSRASIQHLNEIPK